MFAAPPTWSWTHTAEGVLLRPPGGLEIGAIRLSDIRRPLRPIAELVDRELAEPHSFELTERGPGEVIVTAEGEYAALITVRGLLCGREIQRDIGYVVAGDGYAHVIGTALDGSAFALFSATVRSLVEQASVLGGRRRWFWYEAPAGWQARARGFKTDWHPPDFPADNRLLRVWPATPTDRGASAGGFVDSLLSRDLADGFELDGGSGSRSIGNAHGLSGVALRTAGCFPGRPPARRLFAALSDGRFVYPLRFELGDRGADVADAVIASIRPLPAGSLAAGAAGFEHWTC